MGSCCFGLIGLSGLRCLADSAKNPTSSLSENQNQNLKVIPFFAKTDFQKVDVRLNLMDPIDGLNVGLTTTAQVEMGGRNYPAGVVVEGRSDLWHVYFKGPITINGIKICEYLGQHAQTLEVFEIKLCEDLKLPEGVIPAGSVIDFPKELPKKGIKFSDIRCLRPAKETTLKGRRVKSGIEITPNYEVWEEPDRGCMRGAD